MPERRELHLDGLRLSFLEQGIAVEGQPTLVLLHGLMGCADTFIPLLNHLDPSFHVIALDLPGAGRSERREDINAALLPTAELVARVLAALDLRQPILVGHSHGGAVALSVAARFRDSLTSLVLLSPAHPYFDEGDPLIRFYLTLPGRLFAYSMPWYPGWMQLLVLRSLAGRRKSDTQEHLRPYRDNLRTPGTMAHLLRLLASWKKDFSGLGRALRKRQVETPTLLLWGDCDRAVPIESAAQLCEHLVNPKLVPLAGIGHRPAEEAPALVATLLQEWAESDHTAASVRYSPNPSFSQSRIAALMESSFEPGD